MSNLRLRKIAKKYIVDGKIYPILKNINLNFDEGKTYAVLGPSGCGKSTLLNIISGRDRDYQGIVYYNGIDLQELKDSDFRNYLNHEVVLIEQIPILFEHLSIRENINIPKLISNKPKTENNDILNINVKNKVSPLSGGEKQRVNILTSLGVNPKIILADEPTGSLDIDTAITIMEKLKMYAKNSVFLFVTHNEELAHKYADEILFMKDGKIVKNYLSHTKEQPKAFAISTSKLAKKDAFNMAIKLMMGEKKKTSLFITSLITALLCIGLCITMSYGFLNFFKRQTLNSEIVTISINQDSDFTNLTERDIYNIQESFPDVEFAKVYQSSGLIECYFNEEPFFINSSLFAKPPKKVKEQLSNNQIILGLSESFINEIENILNIDDLEEMLLLEDLKLSIPLKDDLYDFDIIDYIIEDGNNNIELYHSNPHLNELLFDGEYIDILLNTTLPKNFLNYILESDYLYLDEQEYFELYSCNVISFKKFNHLYNAIPVFENQEKFWIKHYNNLFYFDDLSINDKILDDLIYFNYSKSPLEYGRYPESINEIVLSSSLYDFLFTSYNGPKTISFKYNNVSFNLNVVGVAKGNDYFIHQDPSWSWEFFETISDAFYKPINFIIIEESQKVTNIVKNLKANYPDLDIYCPATELLEVVDNVINKVVIGFSILNSIMLIISFFSIIIISNLEISDYSKHIKKLKYYGWSLNDNFLIWKYLYISRAFITATISILICFIMCFNLNKIMAMVFDLGSNLFYVNYQMPLVLYIVTFIMVLISLILIKNKVKHIY